MKWYCDTNTSTPTGSGCCIRETTTGGATCLVNATATTATTYSLDAAADTAWAATNALDAATALADNSNNDPFFELFDCSNSQVNYFTCYKFQLDEDYPEDGFPRFDKNSANSIGVFMDAHGGITPSSYTPVTIPSFKGAFGLIASSTAATIAMMSF